MSTTPPPPSWDIFISYASEDYEAVAAPLAITLQRLGLSVWFDRTSLQLGDSLRRNIDEGLSHSRYGIVVLSPSFFGKHYPNRELDGLAQREVGGDNVILPIWHDVDAAAVRQYSAPLADRVAVSWSEGLAEVCSRILRVARPDIIKQATEFGSSLAVLPRLTSGREITDILGGVHMYKFSNDDPQSSVEAEIVGTFLRVLQDLGEIWKDLDAGDHVQYQFDLTERLKALSAHGWGVYGREERKRETIGGVDHIWRVARIVTIRSMDAKVFAHGDDVVVSRPSSNQ